MNKSKALKFLQSPWYWVEMTDLQREALRLACRGILVSDAIAKMGTNRNTYYVHRRVAIKKINKDRSIFEGLEEVTIENLNRIFIETLENVLKGDEVNE